MGALLGVQFVQDILDLLGRIVVNFVAELAVDVDILAVVDDGLQLLAAEADKGPRHAVARAVAAVFDRLGF